MLKNFLARERFIFWTFQNSLSIKKPASTLPLPSYEVLSAKETDEIKQQFTFSLRFPVVPLNLTRFQKLLLYMTSHGKLFVN